MHHPTDRIIHTTVFVTPVVEHWLEREIAQWVHPMKDQSDDPSHHERAYRVIKNRLKLPAYFTESNYHVESWSSFMYSFAHRLTLKEKYKSSISPRT